MTVTTSAPSGGGDAAVPPEDLVSLKIDGIDISVPKGTLVIRAAEQLGIEIPRFCDHPLLDPAGACRQCIVEVEGQRKPMASCTITCTDGMVVKTHLTSPVADGRTRSPSGSPPRCCSTVSGACCAPAAPGSPTRSPATR
jgi:NADH-quinone oxidoreductase subunit G